MPTMTAGESLVRTLAGCGVEYLFGLPGTSGFGMMAALARQKQVTFILALHETCAAGMADGYARATQRPAVAYVSTMPGTCNAIGSLYDACRDRSPLVVLSTQQDTRLLGRDPHTSSSDMVELARQVTKWCWEVPRAERAGEALRRALKVAAAPPQGPVYLALPSNLMSEEVEIDHLPTEPCVTSRTLGCDSEAARRAATLLLDAERPLIVAGSDVARDGAIGDLVALADLVACPVVTEPRNSYHPFPTTHPMAFNLPDRLLSYDLPQYGPPDVVLGIGCRLVREYRHNPRPPITPATKVIQFSEEPWELGKIYHVDVAAIADAKSALLALGSAAQAAMTPQRSRRAEKRYERVQAARAAYDGQLEKEASQGWGEAPIKPWRLVREMSAVLPRDVFIVNECPTSKLFLTRHFSIHHPQRWFASSAAGCLGWGLPAALGVQLANPAQKVVACIGDGSFMFSNQALWTARRYQLPVLIIVFNNHAYMAVKNQLRQRGNLSPELASIGTDFGETGINFARLAQAFDIPGERVEEPEAIRPALERALAARGPALVDVLIDQCQD